MIKFNKHLVTLSRFIYPWTCKLCGETDNVDLGVCKDCISILPWCRRACYQCGLPIHTSSNERLLCGQCLKKPPMFDHLHAALWYQPPISQLITDYKYFQRWENARCLIGLFAMTIPVMPADARLVPMPSHARRIRERGFNAVYECLRFLNKQISVKYDQTLLKRANYTETQTGKTKPQRRKNVKNAFRVTRPIDNEKIILFDEVVTTGATVDEASKQLKKAGASNVEVWCIARTVR